MEQQTVVEWLIEELEKKGELRETFGIVHLIIDTSEYIDLKRKAKEMEKQQMEEAVSTGISKADMTNNRGYFDFDKYYNETYK